MGMYRFKSVKAVTPKFDRAPDTELTCVKVNGDIYTKRFYSNNKDLVRQLDVFGDGDWVELTFDDTQYKNLKSARPGVKPEEKPRERGGGMSGGNVRRADGTSRGDDTNRSAAIYFVKDLVTSWYEEQTQAKKKDLTVSDLVQMAILESTNVFNYIAKGITPGGGTDALDPPDED